MPTVLCSTSSFGTDAPEAIARLRDSGYQIVFNPHRRRLTEGEIATLLEQHRPVGLLAGTEPITRRVLEAARPELRVVARVGVGWDNVDRDAASGLGIAVSRTEGVLDDAVAELALGLMLDVLRRISAQDHSIRGGTWNKISGRLLNGTTVGIVGFGAIGRRTGELCRAFGCKVVYSDIANTACEWATALPLDQLLATADIISLHASGSTNLLGREEFALCRPGAILVNTARGTLVDEAALYVALKSGALAGAGLDVFADEPYRGPLTELDSVVLTPHVGSSAREARVRMEELAVEHLLADLKPLGA